jgi:hypothetical protein
LEDNLLQVLDLVPNTSQLNPIYQGQGQTGYLTWFPQNDAVALTAGPPVTVNSTVYGVRAYLLDSIDDQSGGGNAPMSVASANLVSIAILNRVAQGLPLTGAALDSLVGGLLTGSDFTGATAPGSTSLGVVEELLRILAGEVYRVSSGAALSDGGGAFHGAKVGVFVTAPNIVQDLGFGSGGISAAFGLPVIPTTVPVQTGTQDVNFRRIRPIQDTGELAMSTATGVLSKLDLASYSFRNPSYIYAPNTSTITCGSLAAATNDVVYINGVAFTAIAGAANPALQQFADITQGAATPTAVAASLRTAINDAASVALTGMTSPVANVGPAITVRQDSGNQFWFSTNAPARVTFGSLPAGAAQGVQGSQLISTSARAATVYDASGNVI